MCGCNKGDKNSNTLSQEYLDSLIAKEAVVVNEESTAAVENCDCGCKESLGIADSACEPVLLNQEVGFIL